MANIKVTKAQWIELGASRFSKEGTTGLNVESMSRELGCNKSGFYWYFKNRSAFVQDIVEYWVETATNEIIAMAEKANSPQAKLMELINELFGNVQYKDFMYYLRKIALEDVDLEKLVARAENNRVKYIQDLLVQLKYPRNEAFSKAKILYQYYLGWYELNKHRSINDEDLKIVLEEIGHFIDLGK